MSRPALLRRPVVIGLLVVVVVGVGVGLVLWLRKPPEPAPPGRDSPEYKKYVALFQVAVAALDVGGASPGMNAPKQDVKFQGLAHAKLSEAIDLIPREPAAWANRGLWFLRNNRFKESASDLNKAQELAPADNADIQRLLGLLEKKQGHYPQASEHFRKALAKGPNDLPTLYGLFQSLEQEGEGENNEEKLRLLDQGLRLQPNNLRLLHEKGLIAARTENHETLEQVIKVYQQLAPGWSKIGANDARKTLKELEQEAQKKLPGDTLSILPLLNNNLKAEMGYVRDMRDLGADDETEGEPVQQLIWLEKMRPTPEPPDRDLEFASPSPIGPAPEGKRWDVVLPVWLTADAEPVVFVANAQEVRRMAGDGPALTFPGGPQHVPPTAAGVLPIDWNNDFRMGLLLAGAGGIRFYRQDDKGQFTDVTDKTRLDEKTRTDDYFGAWVADYDMDGDLDVILAPRNGEVVVLRNNGNGSFKVVKPFPGVKGARAFVWADFDNDGAADAAFLDAEGRLHVFANERSGQFRKRSAPEGKFLALAVADVNDDGVFDLVALREDGVIQAISDKEKGKDWTVADLARWPDFPAKQEVGSFRLLAADLDNNGGIDLVAAGPSGARVWLSDESGKFSQQLSPLAERIFAAVDLTKDGRLDLLALSDKDQPISRVNRGKKAYGWQDIRPTALNRRIQDIQASGRMNSFAIGSEIEIRSGLLVQKQLVNGPVVHFGLGTQPGVAVALFHWTTGMAQAEFEDKFGKPDHEVSVLQRLGGSCPFLFTDDGHGMCFVADFMWNTPLGLHINGQVKAGFAQTEEWLKIRGDQLVPRDGLYHVRATADLWETHFFDRLALIVVDHPADTEIWADERFALRPSQPRLYVTQPSHPVAHAEDDRGQDVTEIVRAVDGKYLDAFGRGRYQGITRDHYVEVDLGDDAPTEGPLWLLASGWLHPTDSSINVAIEQGDERPKPLTLEVPDGNGGWKTVRDDIGFPSGKNKTILIRLDGLDGNPHVARRFRLRTNMEIYWDALRYAVGLDCLPSPPLPGRGVGGEGEEDNPSPPTPLPGVPGRGGIVRQQWLEPATAELRFRGVSLMTQADASSPELPQYDVLESKSQRWRDLIGYYTRYGDVRELLLKAEGRYVIMNAGDEIAMTFRAPEAPPDGWKRDFIWVSDGWTKDGNLNTKFSKTVLPLPYRELKNYDQPPGRLEDDPVYQRFPDDWRKYHTRYVTPAVFEKGLRTFRRPRPE